jgi:hypothetical protein
MAAVPESGSWRGGRGPPHDQKVSDISVAGATVQNPEG